MEILGRDRLGRLVYEGDTMRELPRLDPCARRTVTRYMGMICYKDTCSDMVWFFDPSLAVLDMAWSPKRTNYERYFADVGALPDVKWAKSCACRGEKCANCPFSCWGDSFGIDGYWFSCHDFNLWLEMEAVI